VLDFKRVRPLDAAIAVAAVLVLLLGGFLGYTVWSSRQAVESSTPASRSIAVLIAQVRKSPNDIDTRMKLAQAFAVAGRDREATEQYKAVLTVNKEYIPALSGIGFIALKQKEWKAGEGYYRRVVDLLEGNVGPGRDAQLETAYFYLGTALMEQKLYEDAASNFKEALRYRRDASDTHYALAVALRELGNDNSYRESLENALLFDPKMPEANLDYGKILLAEGDIAGAAEHFRTAADEAPLAEPPLEALDELGTAEERIAKAKQVAKTSTKKAVVEARVAVALDPQSLDALVLLGELQEKVGSEKKAVAAYRKALAIDPENAAAKAGLKRVTDES